MADWFFCDAGFGFEFPYNLWGGILLVVGCIVFSLFGNRRCLRSMTGIGFTLVWMAVLAVFLVAEGIGGWKLYHTWGGDPALACISVSFGTGHPSAPSEMEFAECFILSESYRDMACCGSYLPGGAGCEKGKNASPFGAG